MENEKFITTAKNELNGFFASVFLNPWPIWVGSIFISIIALFIFLWKAPWGIAGGYLNTGSWFYYLVGIIEKKPTTPWLHPVVLSTFGLFIGALASALISRQFKIHRASGLEYLKGLVGGALMGAGAALSGGCNVGGFFTAVAMFSFGGFFMWCGLIAGAFVGLRILLWEINNLPQKPHAIPREAHAKPNSQMWHILKPYAGGAIILFMVLQFYVAAQFDKTSFAGLAFLGMLIGIAMHRSRFCFAGAFRDPFMTGDYRMVKAVAISLVIYCFGSAVIKWNYIQPDTMGVHHIWFGSLLGGFIFGVGMLLAGGCASSTLWRLAEGHTKYLVAAISFCLTNPIVSMAVKKYQLLSWFGSGVFLPETIGWGFSLPLVFMFFGLWVLIAVWNERTDKFVISA